MLLRRIAVAVACVSFALGAPDATAWWIADRESTTKLQGAGAVLFESNGDVISAGALGDDPGVVVRRHAGGDGRELWRFRVSGTTSQRNGELARVSLAHDGAGALLATLDRRLADGSLLGTIVKLDPVTGAETWRREIPDAQFYALAVNAPGDTLAVGVLDRGIGYRTEGLAVAVSGQTGVERWRMVVRATYPNYNSPQAYSFESVAVAPNGDFLASGYVAKPEPKPDGTSDEGFSVVRLRSSDGSPLWWQESCAVDDLAVDPAGDVVAAGWDSCLVAKLRGSDGTLLWRASAPPAPFPSTVGQSAAAIAIDAQGDVYAAGSLVDPSWPGSNVTDMTTLKLAGATGATLWRHDLSNTSLGAGINNCCRDRDIALSPRGDVIAFGSLGTYYSKRMIAVSLSAATGTQLWRSPYLEVYTDPSFSARIAIDPQGSIALVSSRSDCQNGCGAYTVVKLRGRSGLDYFGGCGDEIDNDGDGNVDWPTDIGCASASSPTESPACENGVDDDGDGNIDFVSDAGCALPSSDFESPACQNGVDDDGDGLVDFPSDPGCGRASGATEAPACQNGFDDDGDGLIDHPADRGCAALWSATESPQCQNGRDDDEDGRVDHPDDPGCGGPASDVEAPACQNGLDDDGDDSIDYDGGASYTLGGPYADPDPECAGAPSRNTERSHACGLGVEITAAMVSLAAVHRRRRR